ncbi:LexA family transcriptional regulator [Enterococcus cecorum]|nr:LexA family transcriptional regulator [Enterococcus cecorum]
MELSVYVGNKIKYYREQMGMTQEDLAKKLKTTRQSISRYENGDRKANQDILFELADIFGISINTFFPRVETKDINEVYNLLNFDNQAIVYDFAKSKLDEQNTISDNVVPFPTTLNLDAVVSAGTGEWQDGTLKEEVEYDGTIPAHDYVVRVNGDSMQPLFEDNQIIFIRKTNDVRDGQIIVCTLNNETYVKKIMGNRLVSLNKKYDDIQINEYDDFSVVGVVVL